MNNSQTVATLLKKERELQRRMRHAFLFLDPLKADCDQAQAFWQKDPKSQFWSRVCMRSLCAAIEARLYVFRQMAKDMCDLREIVLKPKELQILEEVRVVNNPDGTSTFRPFWLPFPEALKETFRLFALSANATVSVEYGSKGFPALCKTFEIRNRLMHPKRPFDISISKSDIETAETGVQWFNGAYMGLITKIQEQIKTRLDEATAQSSSLNKKQPLAS